jgi:hypothetical protein
MIFVGNVNGKKNEINNFFISNYSHLRVMPRLRMIVAISLLPPPICVHGVDRENFNNL